MEFWVKNTPGMYKTLTNLKNQSKGAKIASAPYNRDMEMKLRYQALWIQILRGNRKFISEKC